MFFLTINEPDLVTVSQALRFSKALFKMSHQRTLSCLLSAERRCLKMVTCPEEEINKFVS